MNTRGDTVRQLATLTLALRRHDITHLQLACRCIMTLGSLDCLILHLPSLHTVTIHRDAICEIHVKQITPLSTEGTLGASKDALFLCSMVLRLSGERNMEMPTWSTHRSYLSSLKSLEVAPLGDNRLDYTGYTSGWNIALTASSVITSLTLNAPHESRAHPGLWSVSLSISLEPLVALNLSTLHLSHVFTEFEATKWMSMALSSISTQNRLQYFHLEDHIMMSFQDFTSHLIDCFRRLDQLLTQGFPHLEQIVIHTALILEEKEYEMASTIERSIRHAMPSFDGRLLVNIDIEVYETLKEEDWDIEMSDSSEDDDL